MPPKPAKKPVVQQQQVSRQTAMPPKPTSSKKMPVARAATRKSPRKAQQQAESSTSGLHSLETTPDVSDDDTQVLGDFEAKRMRANAARAAKRKVQRDNKIQQLIQAVLDTGSGPMKVWNWSADGTLPSEGTDVRAGALLTPLKEAVGGQLELHRYFGPLPHYNNGYPWNPTQLKLLSLEEWENVASLCVKTQGAHNCPKVSAAGVPRKLALGVLLQKKFGIPVNWKAYQGHTEEGAQALKLRNKAKQASMMRSEPGDGSRSSDLGASYSEIPSQQENATSGPPSATTACPTKPSGSTVEEIQAAMLLSDQISEKVAAIVALLLDVNDSHQAAVKDLEMYTVQSNDAYMELGNVSRDSRKLRAKILDEKRVLADVCNKIQQLDGSRGLPEGGHVCNQAVQILVQQRGVAEAKLKEYEIAARALDDKDLKLVSETELLDIKVAELKHDVAEKAAAVRQMELNYDFMSDWETRVEQIVGFIGGQKPLFPAWTPAPFENSLYQVYVHPCGICSRGFPFNEHVHLPCGHTYHDFCIKMHLSTSQTCAVTGCGAQIHDMWLQAKGYNVQAPRDGTSSRLVEAWRFEHASVLLNPVIGRQRVADMEQLYPPPLKYPEDRLVWSMAEVWGALKAGWGHEQEVAAAISDDILVPRSWDVLPAISPVAPRMQGMAAYIGNINIVYQTPSDVSSNILHKPFTSSVEKFFDLTPSRCSQHTPQSRLLRPPPPSRTALDFSAAQDVEMRELPQELPRAALETEPGQGVTVDELQHSQGHTSQPPTQDVGSSLTSVQVESEVDMTAAMSVGENRELMHADDRLIDSGTANVEVELEAVRNVQVSEVVEEPISAAIPPQVIMSIGGAVMDAGGFHAESPSSESVEARSADVGRASANVGRAAAVLEGSVDMSVIAGSVEATSADVVMPDIVVEALCVHPSDALAGTSAHPSDALAGTSAQPAVDQESGQQVTISLLCGQNVTICRDAMPTMPHDSGHSVTIAPVVMPTVIGITSSAPVVSQSDTVTIVGGHVPTPAMISSGHVTTSGDAEQLVRPVSRSLSMALGAAEGPPPPSGSIGVQVTAPPAAEEAPTQGSPEMCRTQARRRPKKVKARKGGSEHAGPSESAAGICGESSGVGTRGRGKASAQAVQKTTPKKRVQALIVAATKRTKRPAPSAVNLDCANLCEGDNFMVLAPKRHKEGVNFWLLQCLQPRHKLQTRVVDECSGIFPPGSDVILGYWYQLDKEYFDSPSPSQPSVYRLLKHEVPVYMDIKHVLACNVPLQSMEDAEDPSGSPVFALDAKTEGYLEGLVVGARAK